MKKTYINPTAEIVALTTEQFLANSPTFGVSDDQSKGVASSEEWSRKKESHPIWGE